jgi:hypothetical protein
MNADTTRETSANDALPEWLRIKGRVPSVHQDATFKSKPSRGWYITNACGAAGMYYLTNRGEWTNGIQSNADSFWPTIAAALEACYLHADLPEGWRIVERNGKFTAETIPGWVGKACTTAHDAYLVVMAAATQAPNASERPDAELLKLLSSARKSFAMHNGIILQACEGMSFDDFAAVVEGLRTLHQRHDPAELTRLRAERDKATETLSAYYPRKDGKPPLSVLANWAGNELERLRPENERLKARLDEIDAGAQADADDLKKMRDGTKLTRAGLVQLIVYQQQDIATLRRERDEVLSECARRNHGASGLCCQLRLQEKDRADRAEAERDEARRLLGEARRSGNLEPITAEWLDNTFRYEGNGNRRLWFVHSVVAIGQCEGPCGKLCWVPRVVGSGAALTEVRTQADVQKLCEVVGCK